MTIWTLENTSLPYAENQEAYDTWYNDELGVHPSQIGLHDHTYDDETKQVRAVLKPYNSPFVANVSTPPPWVVSPVSDVLASGPIVTDAKAKK